MLKCYVLPILLNGVEAWTLKEANIKKIKSFKLWCYRRILNIPWVDRITNLEVLRRIGKDKEVAIFGALDEGTEISNSRIHFKWKDMW